MNSRKLESARVESGISKKDMAKAIGKSLQSYGKKARGEVAFNDSEKITITNMLGLSLKDFNVIFFDGKLPNWKEQKQKEE